MKLNNETYFDTAPVAVDQNRSVFDLSHTWRGTGKNGDLMCAMCDQIYPGDTVNIKVTSLTKMLTALTPTLDNAYIDFWGFAVPNRLTWEHWKEFQGENDTSAWVDETEYVVPHVLLRSVLRPNNKHDYLSQFGLPYETSTGSTGSSNKTVCEVLSLRGLGLIYNEWFRDQNVQAPVYVSKSDNGDDGISNLFGPYKVNRVHDVFGTCVPAPQKGDAIKIALSGYGLATPSTDHVPAGTYPALKLASLAGAQSTTTGTLASQAGSFGANTTAAAATVGNRMFYNLGVNFDDPALSTAGFTVESLRLGLMTQHILEVLATSGSRYVEMLRSLWGVIAPDARLQRPEYLGHSRRMLNMADVVQTSATGDNSTPLGHEAGRSKTVDDGLAFSYSATEHTLIYVLFAVRTARSYSQGIPPRFQRLTRYDWYMPQLANLGLQPVYKKQLFLADINDDGTDIFGYNEPWFDLKSFPNLNTCLLDPAVPAAAGGLGQIWTYGDYYTSAPSLNGSDGEWMKEDSSRVDRTLAVTGQDQFLWDVWIDYEKTSVMPVYGVPGLTMRI